MTPRQTGWFMAVGTVVLLVGMGLAARLSPTPNAGFANSAAVLAIVTGAAVGIERVLEAFWTFVGLVRNSWWPLSDLAKQVENMVSGLDSTLAPFYSTAEQTITSVAQAEAWSQEKLDAAKAELVKVKASANQLKDLAPDNQRVQMVATLAFQSVSYLQKKYPELEHDAAVAQQAITGISDFVASFKDNPGRKLISIYAGAAIGLIVSGVAGLDLFQAASETVGTTGTGSTTGGGAAFLPHLGVALTGLVIGLGSNPTHEVIRTIQEIKKGRKDENNPAPNPGDGGAGGGGERISTFSLKASK